MTPARHLTLGMLLTAAAGFVDVIGFIELGGYFTSFMSGNTTQLGAAIVESNWHAVLLTISLISLFFVGSTLGTLLALSNVRWGPTLLSSAVAAGVLLTSVLTLLGFPPGQTMLVLAATAGAQNGILPMRGAVRLGATFVTGTLYTAGQDLALAIKGKAPPLRWAQHLGIWVSLMGGAAIGALTYSLIGMGALVIPILIYAGFAVGHFAAARGL